MGHSGQAWLVTSTGRDERQIKHVQVLAEEFEPLADTTLPDELGPVLTTSAQKQHHVLLRNTVSALMRTRRPS
jgi:hypothetical protein